MVEGTWYERPVPSIGFRDFGESIRRYAFGGMRMLILGGRLPLPTDMMDP